MVAVDPAAATPLRHNHHGRKSPPLTTSSSSSSVLMVNRPWIRLTFLTAAVFLVMLLIFQKYPHWIARYTHRNGDIYSKAFEDDVQSMPILPKIERIQHVDHYYVLQQSNPSNKSFSSSVRPKGVLVLFHSCHQTGLDWFHLPEHRLVVASARQKGLAVLAVTSQNFETSCWKENDVRYINQVVYEWTVRHNLDDLPLMGLGHSAAASFLLVLYSKINLASMALYNCPSGYPKVHLEAPAKAIPTIWVRMIQDGPIAQRMAQQAHALQAASIPTALLSIAPHPIRLKGCQVRLLEFQPNGCERLMEVLQQHELLDSDGFLNEVASVEQRSAVLEKLDLDHWALPAIDSQSNEEKKPVTKKKFWGGRTRKGDDGEDVPSVYLDVEPFGSEHSWLYLAVQQELEAAQAFHVFSAEQHLQVLDFLMFHANIQKGESGDGKRSRIRVR